MTDPTGRTPLCSHLQYVHDQIVAQSATLQRNGQKAVLVIATDGVSTDGDLAQMLRSFEQLPVWVVVRLCTDEDEIVEYWNNIDSEIEVAMDVLDDIEGEAKEVVGANPWLSYSVPLHRAREGGLHKKAFDLLDERLLTSGELSQFLELMFGTDDLPDPVTEWKKFEQILNVALKQVRGGWFWVVLVVVLVWESLSVCVYYEYCVHNIFRWPVFQGCGVFCVAGVTVLFRCAPLDVRSIHTPRNAPYTPCTPCVRCTGW